MCLRPPAQGYRSLRTASILRSTTFGSLHFAPRLRPVPYQPPCFGGWKGGAGWAVKTRTSQGGNTTEITTDLDTSLTVRQHVRAAIRWWLPQDPFTRQELGISFTLAAMVCSVLSFVMWSTAPVQALLDLSWFVLKLILLWRGGATALILFFCLTRRTRRLASLTAFWQEYSSNEGGGRLLPGLRTDIERSQRRRDSRRYLRDHGFSRKEARRHARMCR